MPRHLIEGLKRFRRETFPTFQQHYTHLVAEGQRPAVLLIGCSDSRVVPHLLTDAAPGDLFIVRNVGNFVPPFDPGIGDDGTPAAIEYALLALGVTDIVVCGHTHCGAVRALYQKPDPAAPHIASWLKLGREAMLEGPVDEDLLRRTERRSIVVQLERLMTYPLVRGRVETGTLSLHGWHYLIEEGNIAVLDVDRGEFVPAAE